ncbi:MAG: crAss001_48 related protein [Verrucomicrobiales bacterium]
MTEEQKQRLLEETQETAGRLNKLNAFMAGDAFPKLERADKDLLYSQQRVMSEYVQILGKRLERANTQFSHPKKTNP